MLWVGLSGLQALASTLAAGASGLANRAMARLGTTAGRALLLASDNGGPNPSQAVGRYRSAFDVALCPSRGVAYLPGVI
jgi:hypothetical protein